MATVWRAHDRALDRPVALKRLHPHLAAQPESGGRFRREALAAAALDHPGIVTVHDAGVDAGGPYLVMEFVDGESLSSRLGRLGALPPAEAVRIALAVAEALDHAHRRGVVHRDIKPANILLGPGDRVRVADFGIARHIAADDRLTDSGVVLGTTPYLAPEVMTGAEPGPRADLYALGVVLYEMLTSRLPFSGENAFSVTVAKREQRPTPPSALVDLPTGLERIVLSAIEGDPSARPPDAASVAAALRPLADVVTPTYQTPLDDGARPPPTAVTTVIATPRHAGGQTRRPLGWLLAGLIAAAGLAAIAVTLLDGRNDLTGECIRHIGCHDSGDRCGVDHDHNHCHRVGTDPDDCSSGYRQHNAVARDPGRCRGRPSLCHRRAARHRFDRQATGQPRRPRRSKSAPTTGSGATSERAEEELRGLLDELDKTQDDVAEIAIRELHDRIARIARTMGLDELSRNDDNDSDD